MMGLRDEMETIPVLGWIRVVEGMTECWIDGMSEEDWMDGMTEVCWMDDKLWTPWRTVPDVDVKVEGTIMPENKNKYSTLNSKFGPSEKM